MKAYYSARSISDGKKVLLINKAVQGMPISRICQEENISRTIFYRWIKQYNSKEQTEGIGFQRVQKKRCARTVTSRVERKVINYAIMRPSHTLRQYAAHSGISVRAVWMILHDKQLSSRQQREDYYVSHGNKIYTATSHESKVMLVKRSLNGEQISKLCNDYGISRTTFYKWLNQYNAAGNNYQALQSQRPKADKHYRYIKGLKEAVLATIKSHPEYSLSRILASVTEHENKIVSRSGVYKLLKRFGLTTVESRLAYAASEKAKRIPDALAEETLPAIPRYSYISYLSPPVRNIVLSLHILFFEDLHQQPPSNLTCEICSFIYERQEVIDHE